MLAQSIFCLSDRVAFYGLQSRRHDEVGCGGRAWERF